MNRIRLERLQVRFRGVSPQVVNRLRDNIGEDVLAHFSQDIVSTELHDSIQIDSINAGTVNTKGKNYIEVRHKIAKRVSDRVMSAASNYKRKA